MIYKGCLKYWRIGIFLPLIYIVICLFVERMYFQSRPAPGFSRLAPETFVLVSRIAFSIGILCIPVLYLLKRFWWASEGALRRMNSPEKMLHQLILRYLYLLCVCDLIGFTGMVLYLVQGQMEVALRLCCVSMLAYAVVYPPRLKIDSIYFDLDQDRKS
ncbi:hypothetical protein JXA32_02160 [Candidatus Sumerlaeota bacterium]|nr:hypothetical protein [Candidatus Sumerlaeota bacterium]